MTTKSFQNLSLCIVATTMTLTYQVNAKDTDNQKVCASYNSDYNHISTSKLTKQQSFEMYQQKFDSLEEKLKNISVFDKKIQNQEDALSKDQEKLKNLELELNQLKNEAYEQSGVEAYNDKIDQYNEQLTSYQSAVKKLQNDIDKWNSDLLPKINIYTFKSNTIEKSLRVLQSGIAEEEIAMNSLESSIMGKCILADKL